MSSLVLHGLRTPGSRLRLALAWAGYLATTLAAVAAATLSLVTVMVLMA